MPKHAKISKCCIGSKCSSKPKNGARPCQSHHHSDKSKSHTPKTQDTKKGSHSKPYNHQYRIDFETDRTSAKLFRRALKLVNHESSDKSPDALMQIYIALKRASHFAKTILDALKSTQAKKPRTKSKTIVIPPSDSDSKSSCEEEDSDEEEDSEDDLGEDIDDDTEDDEDEDLDDSDNNDELYDGSGTTCSINDFPAGVVGTCTVKSCGRDNDDKDVKVDNRKNEEIVKGAILKMESMKDLKVGDFIFNPKIVDVISTFMKIIESELPAGGNPVPQQESPDPPTNKPKEESANLGKDKGSSGEVQR